MPELETTCARHCGCCVSIRDLQRWRSFRSRWDRGQHGHLRADRRRIDAHLACALAAATADIQEIHEGRIGSTVARQKEFSFAIWDQLRQQQKSFSGIAAWSTERFDLGQGGEARYAEGMWVSGSFFQVLQVQPMLGRLIAESDDYSGCGVRGAVISNAFWLREFGGRSNVIGSKLSLDGHPFEILGVTPPSFYGLEVGRNFDVALPLCSEPVLHGEGAWTADSTTWWLAAIGRLKAGWSFKQASAQLSGIAPGIYAATLPAEYDAAARKDYLRFSLHAEPAATGAHRCESNMQPRCGCCFPSPDWSC